MYDINEFYKEYKDELKKHFEKRSKVYSKHGGESKNFYIDSLDD